MPDIQSSFVVLDSHQAAEVVPVTDSLWTELDRKYGDFAGHVLIGSFRFDDDWPTWEMHPEGDEFVCLLSGDAELILATDEGERACASMPPAPLSSCREAPGIRPGYMRRPPCCS